MTAKIRQNPNIKGIVMNDKEEKETQYAEDLWLFLEYGRDNMNEALTEFESFL